MTTPLDLEIEALPEAPSEARSERPARRERLWTWMLVPGTVWMSLFFVSALLLLIAELRNH